MSKFAEAVDKYKADMDKHGFSYQPEFLEAVAKGLGPSIYNADSSLVSCTDKDEVARVKKNFLMGKLGLTDEAAMDEAMSSICENYKGNRRHRAVVYYLLADHFKKLQEVYG